MKKEYAIDAKGQIEKLKDALLKLKGIHVGSLRDFLSVGIPQSDKDSYVKVKQLMDEHAERYRISYSYAFRASSFTSEDLETSDAVMVEFPTFGEQECEGMTSQLVIENKGFSRLFLCDYCGKNIPSWDGAGTLTLSSPKKFSYPFFETPYGGVVLRDDVIETIQTKGLASGIHIRECEIKSRKTILKRYYAIFPEVDLGEPVGDMEFLDPCPVCHSRRLHHKREFLWSFRKTLFNELNFTWTSWFTGGAIIVSTKVYLLLREIQEAKEKHDATFEPVALL